MMRWPAKILTLGAVLACGSSGSRAQADSLEAQIDAYVEPYVRSHNFSGTVRVERKGDAIFSKSYGFADREYGLRNNETTGFHVASLSMQFTAAAVLRLVDAGLLRLDDSAAEFAPGIPGGEKITIRDLLVERSGLPDINDLPEYESLLEEHHTAESLVAKIQGRPLLFAPGTEFLHEEHSAYNLLALIVERKTGKPFANAIEELVFRPAGLTHSGVDDDRVRAADLAKGYAPEGTYGLRQAKAIHWSGKTGNGSAYTTASDEALWVRQLFRSELLSKASRELVLDTSARVGYGWFREPSDRFGQTEYSMNGRAPGFAALVVYLPNDETPVVVLSNIYSSAATIMGHDIAAISLGRPYQKVRFADGGLLAKELKTYTGAFRFGADFYLQNAQVTLTAEGKELFLRWPSGDLSALIPMEKDRFLDRSYWIEVRIERDGIGKPVGLTYGRFRGVPQGAGGL